MSSEDIIKLIKGPNFECFSRDDKVRYIFTLFIHQYSKNYNPLYSTLEEECGIQAHKEIQAHNAFDDMTDEESDKYQAAHDRLLYLEPCAKFVQRLAAELGVELDPNVNNQTFKNLHCLTQAEEICFYRIEVGCGDHLRNGHAYYSIDVGTFFNTAIKDLGLKIDHSLAANTRSDIQAQMTAITDNIVAQLEKKKQSQQCNTHVGNLQARQSKHQEESKNSQRF